MPPIFDPPLLWPNCSSDSKNLVDFIGAGSLPHSVLICCDTVVSWRVKTFMPAAKPPDPRRVSEGFLRFSEGVSEGVSEGFLKGSAEGPFKTPSKRLQEPFRKRLQEGVEIDNALGLPGL